MKRTEVAKWGGVWFVDYFRDPVREENRDIRIRLRACSPADYSTHDTHAEALAHALHEVGLTPTNPEPMEAP